MAFIVLVFTKLTFTHYTSVNIPFNCCFPTQMKNERTGGRCNFIDAIEEVLLALHQFHKYVEIKCLLDATEVFIAYLIACSTCFRHHYAHHQELKSIIQWLLPVVFRFVVFIHTTKQSQ